jgi:hypothetical protein
VFFLHLAQVELRRVLDYKFTADANPEIRRWHEAASCSEVSNFFAGSTTSRGYAEAQNKSTLREIRRLKQMLRKRAVSR